MDENATPTFGNQLKAARVRRGLEQKEAAIKLGMSRSRLSRIETGTVKANRVRLEEVEAMERELKFFAVAALAESRAPQPEAPNA